MEDRKRTIFVILIALVIVIALVYSFSMNLFSRAPELTLPDPNAAESQTPGPGTIGEEAGITVQVEPNTVQRIIADLTRYESYSRTIQVTYSWGDGESETIAAQIWEDGGWVRTDTTLSSGVIEHSIVGDETLWLWYEDGSEASETQIFSGPAKGTLADSMQHIPTYEAVLELDPGNITKAAYLEYDGQPCIYVETEQQELGYLYRYWISVSNGLLMAAETEKSGVLVYQMESNEVISPLSASRLTFMLPDGTILYEPN